MSILTQLQWRWSPQWWSHCLSSMTNSNMFSKEMPHLVVPSHLGLVFVSAEALWLIERKRRWRLWGQREGSLPGRGCSEGRWWGWWLSWWEHGKSHQLQERKEATEGESCLGRTKADNRSGRLLSDRVKFSNIQLWRQTLGIAFLF